MTFDEKSLRTWWDVVKHGRDLVEIRVLGPKTGSGYFTSIEPIVSELARLPDGYGVYYTLNALNPALYGRKQHDCLLFDKALSTTSDKDVIGRDWILIDLDPVRPSGCNSSEEELSYCKSKANEVYRFLLDQGFNPPVVAMSGNGAHILVPVAIKNDEGGLQLVKRFLAALDMLFSDAAVSVDLTCSNASRIAKVPAVYSPKGANTPERPQRMACFASIPDEVTVNAREYVEKVAAMLPEPEEPQRRNGYEPGAFDLDSFLERHNVKVTRKVETSSHTKYILEHCVFDESHCGTSAAIFKMANGAIGYRCQHSSCQRFGWKQVRLHFDPEYGTRKDRMEYRQERDYYGRWRREFVPEPEDIPNKGKKWLSPTDVKYDSKPAPAIPTGYIEIDKRTGGLVLGAVTVISGINASGKSVWINNVLMNVVSRGYPVAVWSGELTSQRFFDWLYVTAAGKSRVKKIEGYENFYRVPVPVAERISQWLDGRLWLYSQNYQNSWPQLLADLKGCVKLHGIKLAVIDNLSALDLSEVEAQSQFEKQKSFIVELNKFCKEAGVHVILVVHPRKVTTFLRKEDILGDGSISNLVDSVYIVHRTGRDFQQRASEFFRKDEVEALSAFSTVVECAKDRNLGTRDFLLGLYYEHETKRLKEHPADNVDYGIFEPEPAAPVPPDPDPWADEDDLLQSRDESPF